MPSPLRSPAPTICQVEPSAPPIAIPEVTLAPLIVHRTACPWSFCQTMSDRPSPVRSATAFTFQFEPLAPPTNALVSRFVPSICQSIAWPVLLCQTRSALPSPLTSSGVGVMLFDATDQADPLAPPIAAALVMLAPFISQPTAWPFWSCQTMSDLPSPLRSATSLIFHCAPLAPPTS